MNRPRSPLASVSVRETCRAFCCRLVSACPVYQKDLQRCPFSSSCCRDPSVCSWELQSLRKRAISKPAMIALVCHLQILRLLRLPETWEMLASSMRVHRSANNNKSIISEPNNTKRHCAQHDNEPKLTVFSPSASSAGDETPLIDEISSLITMPPFP